MRNAEDWPDNRAPMIEPEPPRERRLTAEDLLTTNVHRRLYAHDAGFHHAVEALAREVIPAALDGFALRSMAEQDRLQRERTAQLEALRHPPHPVDVAKVTDELRRLTGERP